MSHFIPSYEDCVLICNSNDNLVFYENKYSIDSYQISIFGYRIAPFTSFDSPVPNRPDLKAYELRGICFVFDENHQVYKRHLLLDKFFNLNQTPISNYDVVKEHKIQNVYNKVDGSIASFGRLPNGKVFARSKSSVQSEHAVMIQKIYDENEKINKFVNWTIDNEIDAIFEFVDPNYRIVLPYSESKLILLRLRDNKTGEYLDLEKYDTEGIEVAQKEEGKTLDGLIEEAKVDENKEGVVVFFEDGYKIKLKNSWYLDRHKLYTTEINHENIIISFILDDQIDDVLSQLDSTMKERINELIKIINNYLAKSLKELDELLSDYTGDIKSFAIKHKKDKLFHVAMGYIRGREKIEAIKLHILYHTKDLMEARRWVSENSIS